MKGGDAKAQERRRIQGVVSAARTALDGETDENAVLLVGEGETQVEQRTSIPESS